MLRAVRCWAAEDTHLGLFGYIHSRKCSSRDVKQRWLPPSIQRENSEKFK